MNFIKIKERILINRFTLYHWTVKNISNSRICLVQNYYETLGLSESCSHEEVKKAFLEKSKQLHPDKNSQNPKNHRLFVAVNEAYSVLIKKEARKSYDAQLALKRRVRTTVETDAPSERVIFYDDSLWVNGNRANNNYNSNAYYGIKGVKKLPNYYIAGGVFLFAVIGVIIHAIAAKIIYKQALRSREERDFSARQNYMIARENAQKHSNKEQLSKLLQYVENMDQLRQSDDHMFVPEDQKRS